MARIPVALVVILAGCPKPVAAPAVPDAAVAAVVVTIPQVVRTALGGWKPGQPPPEALARELRAARESAKGPEVAALDGMLAAVRTADASKDDAGALAQAYVETMR